jgi:hypothetical protein
MARTASVELPDRAPARPLVAIGFRFAVALGLVLVNWLLVVLERGQYQDSHDGAVSVTDALYYTTVTLTTTGYGDITRSPPRPGWSTPSPSPRCGSCSWRCWSGPRSRR